MVQPETGTALSKKPSRAIESRSKTVFLLNVGQGYEFGWMGAFGYVSMALTHIWGLGVLAPPALPGFQAVACLSVGWLDGRRVAFSVTAPRPSMRAFGFDLCSGSKKGERLRPSPGCSMFHVP